MNKIYNTYLIVSLLLLFLSNTQAQVSFTNMGSTLNNISGFSYEDCAVDMNGDYLDDVVRVTGTAIYIDYQQPDGSYVQAEFQIPMQNSPDWSICAGDIDNNGYNDLLFGGGSAVSFIYANETGTDYTEDYKTDYIFSQRSTFADIDNDGNLDAFVCHDVDQSHPYRNDGSGFLQEDQSLIETINLAGNYAAIWVDYDNDWDTDLYITKCRQGSSPGDPTRTNAMYRNNGDGTYTEVAAEINLDDNAQSWATVFEDFDNDGDFDAFIVNHDEANRFMENDGTGVFTEIITSTNIPGNDLGAWENASGDFNNDGFVDIFSELNNELFLNNGDMTFTGYDLPFNDGGIGDFNNDGFLDVINGSTIWMNDANDNNWVKVNTQGIVSNKNGIGARIEIYGDWGIQIREVRAGESFSPMSTLTVHFGIGSATEIDQLIIKWPSGMLTTINNPDINTTHNIPEASCLLDPSILATSGSANLCDGESVTITAPDDFDTYTWSNGETGPSITVTEPGNYSAVLSVNDTCFSLTNNVLVLLVEDEAPTVTLEGSNIFCLGETAVLSASDGENHIWSNGMTGQTIEVSESGHYNVTIDGFCSDDPLVSNEIEIIVLEPVAPIADDVNISGAGIATLTAIGENLEWYDMLIDGTLLGTGETFETPFIDQNSIYYVESHLIGDGALQNGGKLDATGDGGLPGTGAYSYFNAFEPFTILSVTVYLPNTAPAGEREIQLVDGNETVLASLMVNVTEPEQEIELNFEVPAGEQLSLRCTENNLFRNNGGVSYPYPIGDVGIITTSFFGTQYYYYFYNWKIQKANQECISQRIPVNVSILTSTNGLDKTVSALEIHPNPASDKVFIEIDAIENADLIIKLFDATGREVMTQREINMTLGANNVEINVAALPKGVYYFQLNANGQIGSRKIVIQ